VAHLSGRESIDFLLYELPSAGVYMQNPRDEESGPGHQIPNGARAQSDRDTLLDGSENLSAEVENLEDVPGHSVVNGIVPTAAEEEDDFASSFQNLNALEIAVVADAKKFLSQRVVQRMVESIWRGDVIFWETLNTNSVKGPKVYNKK
jgi:hypothetical protein